MSTTESRDAVASFLRAEFRREQESRYSLLRLIPSTSVLSYERIMGLSFAAWNCLEQSNLDQSVPLFKDLITYYQEDYQPCMNNRQEL